MMTNRGATIVSTDRVFPRLRLGLAFGFLVLVGSTQTGCRSDGCSNCDIGSKFTNGIQSASAKLFSHHKDKGCSTCGTLGGEQGVIVDSGMPITPGAITVPAPGTIVPAPSIESAPPQLEPISGSSSAVGPANPAASNRNNAGASRSAYEASNSRNGLIASKRGLDLSRAYQAPSTPTPTAYAPEEPDVFDHLPPVDLPSELSRKVTPIEKLSGDGDSTSSSSPPSAIPAAETNVKTSSAENNSAGGHSVSGNGPAPSVSIRATPGMVRSASVAPALSGGSLPSAEGLDWLKEKGYRTLVDLRQRSEVDPSFPDQVNDHGMLYVPIPFAANPISLIRLARFNDLVNQNDQRPLYFCDTDGRRAGLIWYLRLRSKDHEEMTSARAKAEEIGLVAGDIDEAEKFLKLNFALENQPTAPLDPVIEQATAVAPVTPAVPVASAPIKPPVQSTKAKPISLVPSSEPFDPSPSWRPVVALVLSGLGVPLAYWSSSTLFQRRAPRRASLTAKGPGPRKSLPSSGA